MKLLMIMTGKYQEDDIFDAFSNAGLDVSKVRLSLSPKVPFKIKPIESKIDFDILDGMETDCVFTVDFFPEMSVYCKRRGATYISWVFTFPQYSLYDACIAEGNNILFLPDPELVRFFNSCGLLNVHYLPFAVNPARFGELGADDDQNMKISFIGSMGVAAKETAFERFDGCMDSTKGYIDGLVAAQCGFFGGNVIEMRLPDHVTEDLDANCPVCEDDGNMATRDWIYSQYLFLPVLTMRERINFLYRAGGIGGLHTYSDDSIKLDDKEVRNPMPSLPERFRLYGCTQVSPVIPDRALHGAAPLELFEIMASGSLALTAYQTGSAGLFRHRETAVFYDCFEEYEDAIRYFLRHEDERIKIKSQARKTVLSEHNYEKRTQEILAYLRREI